MVEDGAARQQKSPSNSSRSVATPLAGSSAARRCSASGLGDRRGREALAVRAHVVVDSVARARASTTLPSASACALSPISGFMPGSFGMPWRPRSRTILRLAGAQHGRVGALVRAREQVLDDAREVVRDRTPSATISRNSARSRYRPPGRRTATPSSHRLASTFRRSRRSCRASRPPRPRGRPRAGGPAASDLQRGARGAQATMCSGRVHHLLERSGPPALHERCIAAARPPGPRARARRGSRNSSCVSRRFQAPRSSRRTASGPRPTAPRRHRTVRTA